MNGQTDKITRVLSLYTKLLNGEPVDKVWFCFEHNITERSFDRDIEDIRLYLSDSFSGTELLYDRTDKKYRLSGERPRFLDKLYVEVVLKILLSSGAFRRDEMEGLVDNILSAVTPSNRKFIRKALYTDCLDYHTRTENAILKILGDLYEVLNTHSDVVLILTTGKEKTQSIWAAPLEIKLEDSTFYLVVSLDRQLNQVQRFPLDAIYGFKKLDTFYSQELKMKYKLKEANSNGSENSD